jgi:hypothetical protein
MSSRPVCRRGQGPERPKEEVVLMRVDVERVDKENVDSAMLDIMEMSGDQK